MTGNNVLLDTNIVSAWLKGETAIADKIDASGQVFIPIIVVGELHYGAQYSSNVQKNTSNINKVVARYDVLTLDEETAALYGIIKAELRKKGKPIPENDIWIAAIAMQYELLLITRDNHFTEVEGITLKTW
jgi:tRNA(fMet)-specific endonuclease VapC